ncbi:MAG: integrase core domain-containing protein [Gammaproteobacteria bacterium]|nr:integrase core domain-containing protein [Gammaproteobacteria bacterium]
MTVTRSPWQNLCAERVIDSVQRECTDHLIVLGERHLKSIISEYVDYYNGTRTHSSLEKD